MLAAPALLGCGRLPVAEMPLRLVENYPVVPGSLAGRPVSWLVDTAAQGMLVVPALARELPSSGTARVDGTGGSTLARVVRLPGLRVGGAAMPDALAPVMALPDLATDPPLAGLLGANLLSRYDLEFDLPGGRMALWPPGACPGPRGTAVRAELSAAGEVLVPVRGNGRRLLALLDTGSRATILSAAAARLLGLGAPVSANTAAGVDGARLPVGHTRMRFGLGDEAVGAEAAADTPVSIAPLRLERADMLLGLDQLGRRRFWIGYAAGVVVFAAAPG